MTKICGYVSIGATDEVVTTRLHTMLRTINHNPLAQEAYIRFDGGGMAVLTNARSADNYTRWDQEHGHCLAWCGEIIRDEADVDTHDEQRTPEDQTTHWLLGSLREQDPTTILSTLNGTFALAYYAAETQTLLIANDRYGFMPLYCYVDEHTFMFASEVKAILAVTGPQAFDWESCADFFYIGHLMGQKTLFKHIHAVDAGMAITYSKGTVHQQQYHDFTQTPVLERDAVSTERLALLFTDAVKRRLRADETNTLLLSGGLDSRLILGVLHKLGVTPKAISLEHAGLEQGADGKYAAMIAAHLRVSCDFRHTRPDFLSSPDSLAAFYILDGSVPTWDLFIGQVYPELEPSLGRVWDGLSLDLSLGGSRRIEAGTRENVLKFIAKRRVHRFLLRLILTPRQFRAMDRTFMQRLQDAVATIPPTENQFVNFLIKHRIRRRISINPYQLYAAQVEPVTPTTDKDFMDYVLSIPNSLRLHHRVYISMLQQHFSFLTEVPAFSGNAVFRFDGDTIRKRPLTARKRIKRMARDMLKPLVASRKSTYDYKSSPLIISVLEKTYFDRPIYNKTVLRSLFTQYRRGNARYHHLFKLAFYIELWHMLFLDRDSPIYLNPMNVQYMRNVEEKHSEHGMEKSLY